MIGRDLAVRIGASRRRLSVPTPEKVREARALEILEQINTPESRRLLKDLAAGADAPRTRAAAAALKRLEE